MHTSSIKYKFFYIVPDTSFISSQELHLPSSLNTAHDEERMAVAYAWEEHNALIAKADLDARHSRQMLFAAQCYALHADKGYSEASTAAQQVYITIQGLENITEPPPTDNPATTGKSIFASNCQVPMANGSFRWALWTNSE